MTLNNDIELLSRVKFFDQYPSEQLRMLAFGSRRLFLRGGETLFQQGDLSDGGYVVISGQIDLYISLKQRQLILSSQLEGSLIGEAALISANQRNTSALARNNAELLFLPRELFLRMLREYPDLAVLAHQRISRVVNSMIHDMSAIERKMQSIPDLEKPVSNFMDDN